MWALVERAQAGESAAFGLIYDRYVDTVFRFVYFRVGNRQLAEDLTSDTFLRALKRIGSFTWQGRDLGAWLVTIARNLVADHFKSGRYRLEVTTGDVLDADREDRGPEGSPEAAVVDHITNVALLTAVKQLNPEQQECIVLRFLQGFSVAETAQTMGKNEGAIKALQYRAVRALGPAAARRVPVVTALSHDVDLRSPVWPARTRNRGRRSSVCPGATHGGSPTHRFRRDRRQCCRRLSHERREVPAVSFDFLDRRSAERFAELLDETNGGRRHHTHDRADEELAELVAIGHSLSASRSSVQVDHRVPRRAAGDARGHGRAGRHRRHGDRGRDRAGRRSRCRPGAAAQLLRAQRRRRRIRARGAIVIGVAAGAMAVSGISAASENASPGDALYGVKRSTEKRTAGDGRLRRHAGPAVAGLRPYPARRGGRDAGRTTPRFSGVLDDMDADTRQGVKLLTSSAVARKDTAPLTRVDGFVAGQRQTLEPMLDRLSRDNRERAR